MNALKFSIGSHGITDWQGMEGRSIHTVGCVFFMCLRGHASVSTNMRPGQFAQGDLAVITYDVYFCVNEVSDDFSALFISLPEEIIEMAYYKINSADLWEYLHNMPILKMNDEQYRLCYGWFAQACWILDNITGERRTAILDNMTFNLFSVIDSELGKAIERKEILVRDRAWEITSRLWSLLIRHSHSERSVFFYANALNITPDYLTKVCRKAYGITPKELIDQQTLVDIKRYLTDTSLSVAEIARELNFEDSSYLCRFFRRHTGSSPIEFRSSMKSI